MKTCVTCGVEKDDSEFYGKKAKRLTNQCRECYPKLQREFVIKLKQAAHDHYGGSICAKCGSTEFEKLHIDHIEGGGSAHRIEIFGADKGGHNFYSWLKKNNYPPGFRVLCEVCNCGHRRNY